MDICGQIQLAMALSVTVVLIAGSYSDYKKREVSDWCWGAIGAIGIFGNLAIGVLLGEDVIVSAGLAGSYALILMAILVVPDRYVVPSMVVSMTFSVVLILSVPSGAAVRGLVSSVTALFFLFCYWRGIIRGGADVKCLICLAIAFPQYMERVTGASYVLIETVFSPAIATLFIASIISVAGCAIYCICRNKGKTCAVPGRFCGYMLPLDMLEQSFAWPSERIDEGRRIRCAVREEAIPSVCAEYKGLGIGEIYVTPMIPFILPITVSFVLVMLFGCPFIL